MLPRLLTTVSLVLLTGCVGVPNSTINFISYFQQPAGKLIFSVPPENTAVAGTSLGMFQVAIEDSTGQVSATSTDTISLTISSGNFFGGPTSVAASVGFASYSNLSMNTVGTYTLSATDTSDPSVAPVSTQITITPNTATQLVYSSQPISATSGASLGNIVVQTEDAFNNLVANSSSLFVTLTIQNNAGPGGTLSGPFSVSTVNGIAVFPALAIDIAGSGYTLKASTSSLIPAVSTPFNITAGTASKLAFIGEPANNVSGNPFSSIAVAVEDSAGNTITTSAAPITLAFGNNAGPGILSGTLTVNAVNGVATFPTANIDIAGNGYTLVATSGTLASVTSTAFNITPGVASKLAFSGPPANAPAGAIISAIAVAVEDAAGNRVTSSTASITIAIGNNAGPGGVLAGTATTSASSGLASFVNVNINIAGTGYTLVASSTGLTPATSNAFNISASAASKLAFSTEPSAAASSGIAFGTQPVVKVQDAFGNSVTTATNSITLSPFMDSGCASPATGTFSVTTNPLSATAGIASFAGVTYTSLAGTIYLKASTAGLSTSCSTAVTLGAGVASKLAFSTQPSNSQAGASLGGVAVTIEDGAGNPVTTSTASVTLAIGNNAGPGGTLSGTVTVAAAAGIATFPGLHINIAGAGYTLVATSAALTNATSVAFNITPGAASKLAFITQPAGAVVGASLGTIAVAVEDASGNIINSSTAPVTLVIANNAGPGGVLSGTVTVNAVSGVASFPGLSINVPGVGYTLSAASGVLTSATSNPFNIATGPATQLAFATIPSNTGAGESFIILVDVEDSNGIIVNTSSALVTLQIGINPGGGNLAGTVTANASNGIAIFPNVSINAVGTGYTLTATSGGLTSATSNSFNVSLVSTWMAGAQVAAQHGVYGTQGVGSISNIPGARQNSVSWTDLSGNFWLFGGYGYDSVGTQGMLNDFWKYTPSNQQWTWILGSNFAGQAGVYGTLGTGSASNIPGARNASASWTDSGGNFYLFGGIGSAGNFNDLWEYSASTHDWVWIAGSNSLNFEGIYGSMGVGDTSNAPGGRQGATLWMDSSGIIWIFGGFGFDGGGSDGPMNDLWQYNPSNAQWTWVLGSKIIDHAGAYGTEGVGSIANTPGARAFPVYWVDTSGTLWLFGGSGIDGSGGSGALNDLWKFSSGSQQWTWISGSNLTGQFGTYGTQGVTNAGNIPGAREGAISWIDSSGNLWLFGGIGYGNGSTQNVLNDLWKYTPVSGNWTWIGGGNVVSQPPVYGTQATGSTSNIPGSRENSISWIDSTGNLWFFGGLGLDGTNTIGDLNDLWMLTP